MVGLSVMGSPSPVRAAPAPEPEPRPGTGVTVYPNPGSSQKSQAANQRLAQQVKARLEADQWVLSYQIGAAANQGMVTLDGKVDTVLAKERAAQVAGAVPGVRRVNNRVVVSLPPRTDRAIHDQVRACLNNEPALKSYRETVEVKNGFVVLSGLVTSDYRKSLAEAVAKSVPGVRGVENQLRVDHLASRPDLDIQRDVESRIEWDPRLEDPQIEVRVQNGTVALIGMVENPRARAQAERDGQVAGTKAVDASNLRVRNEQRVGAGIPPAGGAGLPGD